MDYSLKNCLDSVLTRVLKRHPIFWEIKIFRIPKEWSQESKKEKSLSKGKEKERRE